MLNKKNMNLESLPVDIFYIIADNVGNEIENLKYTNRYFYNLLSDVHIRKKFKTSVPIVMTEWAIKTFFVRCIEDRKFGRLVDFFNQENLYTYKNMLLSLCIHFMTRKGLDKLLSKIKPIITTIGKRAAKCLFDDFIYVRTKYPHLFVDLHYGTWPLIFETDITEIRKSLTIDQFKKRLSEDLELMKRHNKIIYNYLTHQGNELIQLFDEDELEHAISCNYTGLNTLIVFFFVTGKPLKLLLTKLSMETINESIYSFCKHHSFYIINYCSEEQLNDIFERTEFLLAFSKENKIPPILSNSRLLFIIDVMERKDIKLTKVFILKSIKNLRILYCNPVEKIKELTSNISNSIIKKCLDCVDEANLLLYTITNYKASKKEKSKYLDQMFKYGMFSLIRFMYRENELEMISLVSYCFTDDIIDRLKSNYAIMILEYLKENMTENDKIQSEKMIQFIQKKLLENNKSINSH